MVDGVWLLIDGATHQLTLILRDEGVGYFMTALELRDEEAIVNVYDKN